MLILLAGLYVGVIWLIFIKLKLLPWNQGTKGAAVIVGVAGLLLVLIGFGMGSPVASGGVTIQNTVVRLAAHSSGRVTKVHARINEPVQAGDPIFEVDRTLYENAVRSAEAGLRQAEYGVQQLRAAWEVAKADVANVKAEQGVLDASIQAAEANVASATAAAKAAESQIVAAAADLKAAQVNVDIGQTQFDRIQDLVAKAVESQAELDQATNELTSRKAALEGAQAVNEKVAQDLLRARAALDGAEATLEQTRRSQQSLEAQEARARAGERKAYAAAEIDGEGEHSSVRSARETLGNAKYDLENCIVRAPTDGYVVALGLTEGDYVRMVQVGSFVSTVNSHAIAFFNQNTVRFIKPGMKAEMALRMYPGRILTGEVESVTFAAGEAQPPMSGTIPAIDSLSVPKRFVVRIRLDETPADTPFQFAASGSVAVYTDAAKPIHVIRKIVMRMQSILNWLPF